jgi:hypothetical protein
MVWQSVNVYKDFSDRYVVYATYQITYFLYKEPVMTILISVASTFGFIVLIAFLFKRSIDRKLKDDLSQTTFLQEISFEHTRLWLAEEVWQRNLTGAKLMSD